MMLKVIFMIGATAEDCKGHADETQCIMFPMQN